MYALLFIVFNFIVIIFIFWCVENLTIFIKQLKITNKRLQFHFATVWITKKWEITYHDVSQCVQIGLVKNANSITALF